MELIFLLLILLVFFLPMFFFNRKQRQQQEQIRQMQDSLNLGDHVVTTAGIHGVVAELEDDLVNLQIAEGITVVFERIAIVRNLDAVPPAPVPGTAAATEEERLSAEDQIPQAEPGAAPADAEGAAPGGAVPVEKHNHPDAAPEAGNGAEDSDRDTRS